MSQVTVKIPCKVGWALLKEYDNRGNKNTTINLSVEVTNSREVKGTTLTKTVNESSREEAMRLKLDASATGTWGPVSATVSTEFEASKLLKDFLSTTTEVSREEVSKWEETKKQVFSIGAGDSLYFYQQIFSGPGIYFTLDTTSTVSSKKTAKDDIAVAIEVVSERIRFMKSIDVAYGDNESDAPEERIHELWDQSDDINHQKKGKYVWLTPQWTNDTDEGATSFEIRIQNHEVEGWKDLAKDAKGDYRYIVSIHDKHQVKKVTAAKLLRSSSSLSAKDMVKRLGNGWVAYPRDINENRGGDFLYIAWKLY